MAHAGRRHRRRMPEEGDLNFKIRAEFSKLKRAEFKKWEFKGLKLAIEAAGSGRRLAAKLGVSQPSGTAMAVDTCRAGDRGRTNHSGATRTAAA